MAVARMRLRATFANIPILKCDIVERSGGRASSAIVHCLPVTDLGDPVGTFEYQVFDPGGSGIVQWINAKREPWRVVERTLDRMNMLTFEIKDARWQWETIYVNVSYKGATSAADIYRGLLDAGGLPYDAQLPVELESRYPVVDEGNVTLTEAFDLLGEASFSTLARNSDGLIRVYMRGQPVLGANAPAISNLRAHNVPIESQQGQQPSEIIIRAGANLYDMPSQLRHMVELNDMPGLAGADRHSHLVPPTELPSAAVNSFHPWVTGPFESNVANISLAFHSFVGRSLYRLYQCHIFPRVPTTVVNGQAGGLVGPPEIGDIFAKEVLWYNSFTRYIWFGDIKRTAQRYPYVFGLYTYWEMLGFKIFDESTAGSGGQHYTGDYDFDVENVAFRFDLPAYYKDDDPYSPHEDARFFGRILCNVAVNGSLLSTEIRVSGGGTGPPVVLNRPDLHIIFVHTTPMPFLVYGDPLPDTSWIVAPESLAEIDQITEPVTGAHDGAYQIEMAGVIWHEITGSIREVRYIFGDTQHPRAIVAVNTTLE